MPLRPELLQQEQEQQRQQVIDVEQNIAYMDEKIKEATSDLLQYVTIHLTFLGFVLAIISQDTNRLSCSEQWIPIGFVVISTVLMAIPVTSKLNSLVTKKTRLKGYKERLDELQRRPPHVVGDLNKCLVWTLSAWPWAALFLMGGLCAFMCIAVNKLLCTHEPSNISPSPGPPTPPHAPSNS
jgi:hypothetical protein